MTLLREAFLVYLVILCHTPLFHFLFSSCPLKLSLYLCPYRSIF